MLYAIVAVLILIADQGMKYWTMSSIDLDVGTVPLIDGVIHFTHIHNSGVAFGLLDGGELRWLLAALAIVFAAVIVFLIASRRISGSFGRWTAVMVLAGALGNGIDRAVHGWVVDMFEFEFVEFAVFNVADIFITVGGILFCLYVIFHKAPEKQPSAGSRGAIKRSKKPAPRPIAITPDSPKPVEPRKKAAAFVDWTEPLPKLDGKGGVMPAEAPEFGGISEIIPTWSPPGGPEKTKTASASSAPPAKKDDMDFSLEDILREFGADE